jgi:hypothetical protein
MIDTTTMAREQLTQAEFNKLAPYCRCYGCTGFWGFLYPRATIGCLALKDNRFINQKLIEDTRAYRAELLRRSQEESDIPRVQLTAEEFDRLAPYCQCYGCTGLFGSLYPRATNGCLALKDNMCVNQKLIEDTRAFYEQNVK